MKMRLLQSILAFCATLTLAQSPLSFPPLLGPHKVGTTSIYLPGKANGVSPPRDIMVSIFYPTFPTVNTTTYPLAKSYDAGYEAYLAASYALPPEVIVGQVQPSQAYLNAPLYNTNSGRKHAKDCPRDHPNVVVFDSGYGNSRWDYTASLSNLASRGYIVIAADHPNDTAYIAYPTGPVIKPSTGSPNPSDAVFASLVALRVKDLNFVLDSLSRKTASVIPGLKSRLDVSRVAIYGHSLGGATAASSLFSSSRFIAGLNVDGPIFDPVATKGVKNKPFLILAAQGHDNVVTFPAWKTFWDKSKGGLELELQVKGAGHGVFSDLGVFYSVLRALGMVPDLDPTGEGYGTIGTRIWELQDAYYTAFAEYVFSGEKSSLLKGPSAIFPEISFNAI